MGDCHWLAPYQFPPGKSGNPNGRPKGVKGLLKKMTLIERVNLYNKILHMTLGELEEFVKDPDTPVNEVLIGLAVVKDCKEGKMDNYERLLERIIGKVPQKNEVTGADGAPIVPPNIVFSPVSPSVPKAPETPPPEQNAN